MSSQKAQRPTHYELADLHTYVVPLTPKTLRETLCVAEFALQELGRQKPGYNAGGTIASHLAKVQILIEECDRKRPTGSDGKHGNLHTPECGCDLAPASSAAGGADGGAGRG